MKTKELDHGIHDFNLGEFFKEYCWTAELGISNRWWFVEPLQKIYEWAESAGAAYILIGGSFVSPKKNPADIDLLVVFSREANVQKCPESILINEIRADIQYLSMDNEALLDSFIYLLAHSKSGKAKGVVRISINSEAPSPTVPHLKPALYEIVRDSYEGRVQIIPNSRKGMLIPIHGINTTAQWLNYFSLIATNAGWGVAPFVYGREWVTTLARKDRREKLAEDLHVWLVTVRSHHNGPIGVLAHSLGSYIFAKYLELSKDHKFDFCGVVLAGSILNTEYDWSEHLNSDRIAAVCNTSSKRDKWAGRMPDGGPNFARDRLYGKAGNIGFKTHHPRLLENKADVLNHVNMFQDDAIKRWLDFFEISLKLQATTPEVRQAIDLARTFERCT